MAKNRAGEASTYCEVIVDQLSDSDGRVKRNSKTKNERQTERQDPARGMSTDMMESDDEVNGMLHFVLFYSWLSFFHTCSLLLNNGITSN